MFLKNCWYVAARSEELPRHPDHLLSRLLLNEPVVMYRRTDGGVVALEDRCCHRRAPLSKGKVEGDCLRCGYHGFLYEPSGKCISVPGSDRIPPKAKVRAYPVVEKHRWIWIWPGDPALADASRIPDFRHNDMPGWTSVESRTPAKADYLFLIDNILDLSHVAFVHARTIGSAEDTNADLTWERGSDFVCGTRVARDLPPSPRYRKQGITCNFDVTKIMTFSPPCHVTIEITRKETGSKAGEGLEFHSMILNSMTPETASSCHYFWASARDSELENQELSKYVLNVTAQAFDEDKEMLEAQQAIVDLDPGAPTVAMAGDAGFLAARRMVGKLIEAEAEAAAAQSRGTSVAA
jgi:phenylpropionate dioxygenase-like ring-hydroxylating dioxygenase large terminal subunit